jgi:hypothetical protein
MIYLRSRERERKKNEQTILKEGEKKRSTDKTALSS